MLKDAATKRRRSCSSSNNKMSVAKIKACSTPGAMMPEQKTVKSEKEGNESLDNIIKQAIGKDPLLSFSRASESPIQWIQLLHALDQQGSSRIAKGPINGIAVEGKERSLDYSNGMSSFAPELNGVKDHSAKGSGIPAKVTNCPSEHMQTLKIPDAVVAFAQAAAKANGEPEKYLPGWPLLSPSKVCLQKCDKCSQEFCSPINYRRHVRLHRRSLNVDKVSPKNRQFLAAFWDKLSPDEAKELVSFKNDTLEEVAGSSVIRALASLIRKPGFSSLPQAYVKAGATLLDVVQARPPKFPISSQEFFSLLDDASENTFLCAGTAISLQKFLFDGGVGKIALEMKNLVACTSFLLEQKLVKAWLADKDAEALRCQKLLVEEEEAAQKRQADLLERRRLKKLRLKEQKLKDHTDGNKADHFEGGSPDTVDRASCSAEAQALSLRASSETVLNRLEAPVDVSHQFPELARSSLHSNIEADLRCHMGFEDANQKIQQGSVQRQPTVSRWPVTKPARNISRGYHLGQAQKHSNYKDPKATLLGNGQKVWTRKTKPECEEVMDDRGRKEIEIETRDQLDKVQNCEVLIGSISVAIGDSANCHQDVISSHQNKAQKVVAKPDSSLNGLNLSTVKFWRRVARHENGGGCLSVQNHGKETEQDEFPNEDSINIHVLPEKNQLLHVEIHNGNTERSEDSQSMLGCVDQSVPTLFSSRIAEVFLAQRWEEAMASDHVKVVLSPEINNSFASNEEGSIVAAPADVHKPNKFRAKKKNDI